MGHHHHHHQHHQDVLRELGAVRDVSCGWDFTLAVTDFGEMVSWGSNRQGQLGLAPPPPPSSSQSQRQKAQSHAAATGRRGSGSGGGGSGSGSSSSGSGSGISVGSNHTLEVLDVAMIPLLLPPLPSITGNGNGNGITSSSSSSSSSSHHRHPAVATLRIACGARHCLVGRYCCCVFNIALLLPIAQAHTHPYTHTCTHSPRDRYG
jgi:hypothetical protein